MSCPATKQAFLYQTSQPSISVLPQVGRRASRPKQAEMSEKKKKENEGGLVMAWSRYDRTLKETNLLSGEYPVTSPKNSEREKSQRDPPPATHFVRLGTHFNPSSSPPRLSSYRSRLQFKIAVTPRHYGEEYGSRAFHVPQVSRPGLAI
ncbi:hypothetical protein PoB_001361200 [Plakobranchus ocellatus]|uniref:Uncharacterized protein n=1 Tax=Plakobranchus ocellatus TaxID=259542 RepID=A0AAV3YVU2_9GAST|nr:hypothetical protein PoB_001361200 [Plakobranchus ocellatus]